MKPKIVIYMDGGLIDRIISNEKIDIEILDYDLENIDISDTREINGQEVYRYMCNPLEVNPALAEQLHKEIKKEDTK